VHESCGVSFLIPNLVEKTNESTTSALFSSQEQKLVLALSCEKKSLIQLKNEKIGIINSLRAYETITQDTTSYRIYNPKNGLIITVTASKEYLPLLQKSLTMSK